MLGLFKTTVHIDGKKVKVPRGATILEAARRAGIEIPTLCHVEGLPATGVCRVCVVEVEGARTLAGSCHTPVSQGMSVRTNTPKVIAARKLAMALMMAAHTGECVNDPNAENCMLHNLASEHEVGAPRFKVPAPRFHPAEYDNPCVIRDLSKCIMCRRCVTACREIAGKGVLAVGYRGFESKIVAGYDEALATEECRHCGICVEYCPTGALSSSLGPEKARAAGMEAGRGPGGEASRAKLLPMLKKEIEQGGCLTRQAMERAARRTGLSLGEVYGVASFYSFLPRDAKAENRIRICRCVPCEMKGAKTIIGAIEKELGIGPGEATEDGKFAIEVVGCIGACDRAPAMLINDEVFGGLTPRAVRDILSKY